MADYDYILFDTAPFGNVANNEMILFQTPQGSDATHTEAFTNMRGAGSLSQGESFKVNKISVMLDFIGIAVDLQSVWIGNFLELRVSDKTVFKSPLPPLANSSFYSGVNNQTAAANFAEFGPVGDGYELAIPIVIPGGTLFRVRVFQVTALSAVSRNMKVLLHGTYSIA